MLFTSSARGLVNGASYFQGLSVLGNPEGPSNPTFQFDVNIEFYYCIEASAPAHTVLHYMSTPALNYNPTLLSTVPTNMLAPGNGKAGNLSQRKPIPKKKPQTPKSNNGAPKSKAKAKAKPKPKAKQKAS